MSCKVGGSRAVPARAAIACLSRSGAASARPQRSCRADHGPASCLVESHQPALAYPGSPEGGRCGQRCRSGGDSQRRHAVHAAAAAGWRPAALPLRLVPIKDGCRRLDPLPLTPTAASGSGAGFRRRWCRLRPRPPPEPARPASENARYCFAALSSSLKLTPSARNEQRGGRQLLPSSPACRPPPGAASPARAARRRRQGPHTLNHPVGSVAPVPQVPDQLNLSVGSVPGGPTALVARAAPPAWHPRRRGRPTPPLPAPALHDSPAFGAIEAQWVGHTAMQAGLD